MFNPSPKKIVQTNRWPFLIGLLVLMLVMGVLMFRSQLNAKKPLMRAKPRQSIDIGGKTSETGWFNDEKFKNMKLNLSGEVKLSSRQQEARVISSQEAALKKEEIEDEYSTRLEIKKIDDKNKIDEKKMEIEAARSSMNIEVPGVPGTQMPISKKKSEKEDLTEELNQVMNMVKYATGDKFPALKAFGIRQGDADGQDSKEGFLTKPLIDDDYLEKFKEKPRSPYEVKAGSYISAALITGINSDLPGNVNAQVIENVYDSISGNYLLIPQGTRLVGEYNSSLTFGQNRVQVVWNRLIFPDGKSIDLPRMQGIDGAGYTGFHDKVDNHYLRIYGNAVLLSLVGAGYDILNQGTQQNQQYESPRSIVAANVGQKLSDVSSQALERNMNVQPTLMIAPGYKFKVMVMKDMVLENVDDAPGTLSYSK